MHKPPTWSLLTFAALGTVAIVATVAALAVSREPAPARRIRASSAPGAVERLFELTSMQREILAGGSTGFRLLVSSNQHAEIDPCGCTTPQSGGLARRITLHRAIREKSPLPCVAVEGGDSLFPAYSRKVKALLPLQMKKADLFAAFLARAPYDVVGLGEQELLMHALREDRPLPDSLSLWPNVARGDTAASDGPFHRVVRPAADVCVAIINLIDPACLSAKGINTMGYRALDPRQSVAAALAAAPAHACAVLLSHVDDVEALRLLVAEFPSIRVIVDCGHLAGSGRGFHSRLGSALVVRPPDFGSHVTVVDCFIRTSAPAGSAEAPVDLSRIEAIVRLSDSLSERQMLFADASSDERRTSDARAAALAAELDRERAVARQAVFCFDLHELTLGKSVAEDAETLRVVASFKAESERADAVAAPAGAAAGPRIYETAESCASCHKPQFEAWKATRHAHAFDTLKAKQLDRNVECLTCHTTGFLTPGGVYSVDELAPFRGVQCMSCHVPDAHAKHPASHHFPKVSVTSCLECHTRSTSPNFKYDEFILKATCCPPKAASGSGH